MPSDAHAERDERLVRRIRAADHDAFEALFRIYADRLCTFAAEHIGDRAAEDVVQAVFCDLWDRREDWHPKGSVRAYLYRAVRNTALDRRRHREVEQTWRQEENERDRPGERTTPVQALQHQELSRVMRQAVEELPDRRRVIYRMARRHDMTYAEIAAALDIAPKTVENQMGRALKTLRDKLRQFATFLQ